MSRYTCGIRVYMAKNNFIRSALKHAHKSILPFRVGAVIVSGGRIISSGYNVRRFTRRLRNRHHEEGLCAEQAAILRLLTSKRQAEMVGATIYVTRTTKRGKISIAKPCSFCQELSRSVGIRKVFYTDETSKVREMKL